MESVSDDRLFKRLIIVLESCLHYYVFFFFFFKIKDRSVIDKSQYKIQCIYPVQAVQK